MKISAIASLLTAVLVCSVRADDPPEADPDLPQPFDVSATQELLAHSPFTRTVDYNDSLRLTGIAYVGGKPVATFLNTDTKQSITLSDEPNAQGWRLAAVTSGAELRDSEVTLQVGQEEVVMHYGDAQMSPGASKKGMPTVHLAGSDKGSKSSSKSSDHVKTSSLLGEHGKELYASLSSEARSRFKELLKSRIEKQPDLTTEQRSAYAQKIFASIKASDQKSDGGSSGKVRKSKASKLN